MRYTGLRKVQIKQNTGLYMKQDFYIFRHGQTDYNIEKRVQSFLDIPLNAQGIAQAHALAENLANIKFDCIYSSTLSRALDTAKIVIGNRKIKIITEPGLRERNLGMLSGKIMNLTDAPANTPVDMTKDIIDMPATLLFNGDYAPENGETDKAFIKRVCDTLVKIAINTNAKTIGIATHAGVIGALVRNFTDFNFTGMPNAEYLRMQFDGKNFSLPEPPTWLLKNNQLAL